MNVPAPPATQRKVVSLPKSYAVEYSYETYEDEPLTAHFEVSKSSYDAQDARWGYREADLSALRAWRDASRQAAYEAANSRGGTQEQLNDELALVQAVYERKFRDYIVSRGFALEPGGLAKVDLAEMIRRSAPKLAGVARELERSAKSKGRGSEWMIAAATSLVQTAIAYKEVPTLVDGVHTGGVFTPAKTMVEGWGDCDTKVALLGAIMENWSGVRMIVVELPDHFLLGFKREPRKGESYLRWGATNWVLIEPAGPAWLPPGYIGDDTKLLFESGRGYVIDPVL